MRFNPEATWGANAGLTSARNALEPIKAKVRSSEERSDELEM